MGPGVYTGMGPRVGLEGRTQNGISLPHYARNQEAERECVQNGTPTFSVHST